MSFEKSRPYDGVPVAIEVKGVSKHYHIYERPEDRFKQLVLPRVRKLFGRPPRTYFRDYAALHGISFTVGWGETVGILGRNGAGKSTLLQIICGTLNPSAGSVETHGRIAALLELGAGFNPEFSGRENVFLNAAILGLSREEAEDRFDAIADFADIGSFIDLPVKTYSSGMYVRLAFAVQAQIDPDILIVDEALAVGDARFQAKCFARLKELRERGTAILMVTHSTEQVVTHCDRAILLEGGRKEDEGEPRQIVNRYLDRLYGRSRNDIAGPPRNEDVNEENAPSRILDDALHAADPEFLTRSEPLFATRPAYNPYEYRWGDRNGEIEDFFIIADGKPFPETIEFGSHVSVYLKYTPSSNIVRPIIGITLKTKEGVTVYGTNTELINFDNEYSGTYVSRVLSFKFDIKLGGGDYFVSVGLASRDLNGEIIPHDRRYDSIHLQIPYQKEFFGLVDVGLAIGSSLTKAPLSAT